MPAVKRSEIERLIDEDDLSGLRELLLPEQRTVPWPDSTGPWMLNGEMVLVLQVRNADLTFIGSKWNSEPEYLDMAGDESPGQFTGPLAYILPDAPKPSEPKDPYREICQQLADVEASNGFAALAQLIAIRNDAIGLLAEVTPAPEGE